MPIRLELALLNLAVNARDAMPDGGTLSISAELVRAPRNGQLTPGDYLCLSLIDSGVGMDEVTLAKATEPFFTTKGPGKGTGLGLSMVHGMAAQSGGALYLSSSQTVGTTVRLFLPLAETETINPEEEPSYAMRSTGSNCPSLTVLIVDDDPLVRTGTAAMLEDLGHIVIEAGSGAEALHQLANPETIDLVLTDYAMPGMNGADLIRQIVDRLPQMRTIFASGYAEASGAEVSCPCVQLTKPFNQDELATAISKAMAPPHPAHPASFHQVQSPPKCGFSETTGLSGAAGASSLPRAMSRGRR